MSVFLLLPQKCLEKARMKVDFKNEVIKVIISQNLFEISLIAVLFYQQLKLRIKTSLMFILTI